MISKPALYYDGECKLCNTWLRILRGIDKNGCFLYISIQSETGRKLLNELKTDTEIPDSVIFEKEGMLFYRSEAVIECLTHLGGIWKNVKIIRILPLQFRDMIYMFIAKNRYKWFGKSESCEIV